MSNQSERLVVFVHGWSVTNTNTYGGLPKRLINESRKSGLNITVKHIYLGRYISFHDEVRLRDISYAFQDAVERELQSETKKYGRFTCITHSTGGPVVRDWWQRYYHSKANSGQCPMSHLVMLAPANFGSALAQLGKARIGRLKAWFEGIEPGKGVLDWLELGGPEAWDLNNEWIECNDRYINARGIFPFVLTGQSIDRAIYDNLNTYTGETGSDGVVRVASANLNSTRVRLRQVRVKKQKDDEFSAPALELADGSGLESSPRIAFRIISGKSHSGKDMGIMRSVSSRIGVDKDAETISTIIDCLKVSNRAQYNSLCDRFDKETKVIQEKERKEIESRFLLPDNYFIHDSYSMVIFRVKDEDGYPVEDYDLILTAGNQNDPNLLPKGFAIDRQRNQKDCSALTYYFNWDVMVGCKEVKHNGKVLRATSKGAKKLGIRIIPRPSDGFVHYLPCEISASSKLLSNVLLPNQTTLVDIELRRVIHRGVFELDKGIKQKSFKNTQPGGPIV